MRLPGEIRGPPGGQGGEVVETAGATERLVRRLAVRYSVLARTAIVVVCGLFGIFVAPTPWLTAVVVGGLLFWSVPYVRLMVHGPGRWVLPGDAGLVAAVCLTQLWTVPPAALESDEGWVIALASMTLVVYQWHTSLIMGATAVAIVDGAFFAGVVLATPASVSGAVTMLVWIPVEAALSRLLWLLVRRGAAAADREIERAEEARRTAAVAAAARAAEREYSATLHDTAASTLLMVGLGEIRGNERWLRAQAERDLRIFDGRTVAPAEADLTEQLREVIADSGLEVTAELPDSLPVPTTAGTALCQAVREALSNVARHARTETAEVTARAGPGGVVITVADHGIGFAPELVPATRWGVTESIINRVAAIGGRVDVRTAPGAGTTVRLEWRHG